MKSLYLTLLLLSAATLAFQIALTRFFALAQGSHLAFMAISLALLGIGASGAYLSLRSIPASHLPRRLSLGATLFTLSIPTAHLAINTLPFDAYRLAWEPLQLVWLTLYYLVLTAPFFFSGLVVGAALAAYPDRAGPIYAANLLGASLGPPLALLALAIIGGSGVIFLCALLDWLAVGITIYQGSSIKRQVSGARSYVLRFTFYIAITLTLLYFTLYPPALFDIRLTPYKALSQALLYPDSELIFSEWNAFSRVDVIRSSGIHSAPGLSFAYTGQLPPQLGLVVDGDNLVPLTRPEPPTFTHYLLLALPFILRPEADVLILEPGGGLAVLTALENGARSVTVIQSNHTVAEAVSRRFTDFTAGLYSDPRVTLIVAEPRSFLRRAAQQFDLVILPLTDSFRPVTAGAYTLNEDYRYTVEAFTDALARLSDHGLLVAERWLQLPPSESLRLWGIAVAALRQQSSGRLPADVSLIQHQQQPQPAGASPNVITPADHLLALRSLQTALIIAGRAPLTPQDVETTRRFATEKQFDLTWRPGMSPDEANRYSILAEPVYYQTFTGLLNAANPDAFYAAYPYAVAPPTDDHPFFFHFFKWGQTPQIVQTLGKTWQPFGGSGYLVLVVLLALVMLFSAILILLPLLWLKDRNNETTGAGETASSTLLAQPSLLIRLRYLLYFTLLGLGFLFVEIPLLQRFILYLGQPAYAFGVVVSALLVASGIGSGYLSGRCSLRWVLPLVALLTLAYPLLLSYLFDLTLSLPFAGRVLITVAALFPLGLLLGVPFPRGLTLISVRSAGLTPWVWAVNGCASVISAVLAAMIALTWGFSAVLWSAAVAYSLAGVAMWGEDISNF
jgi:hypothetical protein